MALDQLVHDPITRLFAQVAAILLVSRLLGVVAQRLGQPRVIAEIAAGIVLGPSLLGWWWPEAEAVLFPAESLGALQLVSQLGLVLFMFLVGLELDPGLLRGRVRASVVISQTGIVVPFALGLGLASFVYDDVADPAVSFPAFALFMGAAMSVTAFPVLARILSERRLLRSRIGALAVACAAVDDVTAWCILAFVVAIARSTGIEGAIATTGMALAYLGVMLGLVRPLLTRLASRVSGTESLSRDVLATVLLLLVLSSWATELIGVHALFGAFVLGATLPKGGIAHALAEKLEDLVLTLLLPLFFAYSGVRTHIGLLDSTADWALCGLIVAVAVAGKFGGSALAARLTGLGWREAAAIGVLMNTRGLMELVVLNVGLDIGVITPTLFAMMVVMALVTTVMTSPIFDRLYPAELHAADALEDAPEGPVAAPTFHVLVCVASGRSGPGLLTLAGALSDHGRRQVVVDALHLLQPTHRASTALDEEGPAVEDALGPMLERARELDLSVRPVAFVSTDPSVDICQMARVKAADVVLLGWHRPLVGGALLGGVVRDVLDECPSAVGVLVDRGLPARLGRVLVPFRGAENDAAALVMARRIADRSDAVVTVVAAGPLAVVRGEVAALLGSSARVVVVAVEEASAIDGVLAETHNGHDLLVVGLGKAWGLERRIVSVYPERLMDEAPCSILVVRGSERLLASIPRADSAAVVA